MRTIGAYPPAGYAPYRAIYFAVWAAFATWANVQFYREKVWLAGVKTILSLALTQLVITTLMFAGVSIWFSFFRH